MGRATPHGPTVSLGNRMVPQLRRRRRRGWLLGVVVVALVAGFLLGLTREGATPERPLAPDVDPNNGILAGPSGLAWTGVHAGGRASLRRRGVAPGARRHAHPAVTREPPG